MCQLYTSSPLSSFLCSNIYPLFLASCSVCCTGLSLDIADSGMPLVAELYSRSAIRDARLISNPGCYATSIQALIAPLLPHLDAAAPPTVFGISGYSGAGTKAAPSGSTESQTKGATVPKISPEDLQGGVRPYSLTDHIHEREAARHLGRLGNEGSLQNLAFVPAVAPWFQGIISTVSAPLNANLSAKDVKQLYLDFFQDQGSLVEIGTKVPEVHDIALQHAVKIGGFQVHSGGKRVVVVAGLDNLLKGAATQCLQNLNITLGYDELAGIVAQ